MKSHMVWFLFLVSFLSMFPAPSESMVRHYKFNVSVYLSTCIDVYLHTYSHTHTHTQTHIYIYILIVVIIQLMC